MGQPMLARGKDHIMSTPSTVLPGMCVIIVTWSPTVNDPHSVLTNDTLLMLSHTFNV